MNRLDQMLCQLPQSTNAWHCPWFKLILVMGLMGAFFGGYSLLVYDAWLGMVAVVVGGGAAIYTTYHRFKKDDLTC